MRDGSHVRRPEFLFVYGTLLSTVRGPVGEAERRALRWHGRRVGRATLGGRLHQMEGYPGLVPGRLAFPRVHGEVWRIVRPRQLWPVLDAYEGLLWDPPDYARGATTVRRADGRRLATWVYRPSRDITGLPLGGISKPSWQGCVDALRSTQL